MFKKNTCLICGHKSKLAQTALFDDRYGAPGLHDIYRCVSCGFGKTTPGLKRTEIGQFYATHYPLSLVKAKSLKSQVRLITPLRAYFEGVDNTAHWHAMPGQTVLDIGSASGISLLEIQARGARAYGVEPDPHGLKVAKQLGLKVHHGFLSDLPFPGVQFDLITASQVLEHEPDPRLFLRSLRAKLGPGGQAVLSFPNYDALYRHIFGRRWLHWHIPYHLNFFTLSSLSILAKSAGFKVTSVRTITPNLWTILQLRTLFVPQKHGIKNPVWAQADSVPKPGRRPIAPSLFMRIIALLGRLSVWLIMPFNRIIDALGYGESYLVTLQKDH